MNDTLRIIGWDRFSGIESIGLLALLAVAACLFAGFVYQLRRPQVTSQSEHVGIKATQHMTGVTYKHTGSGIEAFIHNHELEAIRAKLYDFSGTFPYADIHKTLYHIDQMNDSVLSITAELVNHDQNGKYLRVTVNVFKLVTDNNAREMYLM